MKERTFYIMAACLLIFAGWIGYLLHPCHCDTKETTKANANETTHLIDSANTVEQFDTIANRIKASDRHN